MSNHRISTSKSKEQGEKQLTLENSQTAKVSSIPLIADSKTSIADKVEKIGLLQINPGSQIKDLLNLISDDGLDLNFPPELNNSELSIIKMLEGEPQKELSDEDNGEKRFTDEIYTLKKDLAMKNNLVERLMKENNNLRMEMEEILSTMEGAKDKIDSKLRECNMRIQELEEEIKALQEENKYYKDLFENQNKGASKKEFEELEKFVGKHYSDAKDKLDFIYNHLNDKLTQFIEISKSQFENFNESVQERVENMKSSKPTKISERISLQPQPQSPSRIWPNTARASIGSTPTITHTKTKLPSYLQIGLMDDTRERASPVVGTTKRKRGLGYQCMTEIGSPIMGHSNEASRLLRSPKTSLGPKIKTKLNFKV